MKIKHYQGYGSVNAKKVSEKTYGDEKEVVILVTGNHEYGIHRDDRYDVCRWLLKPFRKNVDSRNIVNMTLTDGYDSNTHEETCEYRIRYKEF